MLNLADAAGHLVAGRLDAAVGANSFAALVGIVRLRRGNRHPGQGAWLAQLVGDFTDEHVAVERAVTTYQKNDFGQADNSYLDSETLHQSAYIIRFLKGRITSKYGRHKLANDGTRFGAGQALVTSAVIRAELIAGYYILEQMGIVENAGAFAQYLVVERSLTDPTRVDVLYPPDLVNQLRVFALQYQFRLQYQESRAGTDKGDPNQLPHAVNASLGRSK